MKNKKGNELYFTNDSPVHTGEIACYEDFMWSEYIYAQDSCLVFQLKYTMIM